MNHALRHPQVKLPSGANTAISKGAVGGTNCRGRGGKAVLTRVPWLWQEETCWGLCIVQVYIRMFINIYIYTYKYVMIIVCLSLFIHVSCTMCFNVRIWRFAIIAAQCRTGCQCQPSKFMGSPARSPALSLLGSRCPLTFASWCCSTSLDATTVLFVSHTDTACSGTTEWTGRIAVGGWWWVGLRFEDRTRLGLQGFSPVSVENWVSCLPPPLSHWRI